MSCHPLPHFLPCISPLTQPHTPPYHIHHTTPYPATSLIHFYHIFIIQESILEQGYSLPKEYNTHPTAAALGVSLARLPQTPQLREIMLKKQQGFGLATTLTDGASLFPDERVFIDSIYAQNCINEIVEGLVLKLRETLHQPLPWVGVAEEVIFEKDTPVVVFKRPQFYVEEDFIDTKKLVEEWTMQLANGRIITARFLFVLAWECWKGMAVETDEW